MALAVARKFGSKGYDLTLAARSVERLKAIQADIQIRQHVKVDIGRFDAQDIQSHAEFYANLPARPDVVICVFGFLGDQQKAQKEMHEYKQRIPFFR